MNRSTRRRSRRGVLLLLVLAALTFFMLLGAFLLVMSIRARAAARAFADATQVSAVKGAQARALLDEALLIALRGSKDPNVRSQIRESILGDKYGLGTEASGVTLAYSGTAPLLTATITSGTGTRAWFGRVLTLSSTSSPFNQERGLPVSFRIVGASGSTAYLANLPVRPDVRLPTAATNYQGVINGREFSFTGTATANTTAAEPWDAYDDSNPWLAHPSVNDGQVGGFVRVSFGDGSPPMVDNDNDGVADGVFLTGIVPDRPVPGGGMCRHRVSYLVLDLDGRLNVNTSGGVEPSGTAAIPRGMGYGPADLVPTAVISPAPVPLQSPGGSGTNALWSDRFLVGTPATVVTGTASSAQRRPPPGVTVIGRYGRNGLPGRAGDDLFSAQQTIATGSHGTYGRSLYALTVAGTNAFADLQGNAEVTMRAPAGDDVMPTMRVTVTGTSADDGFDDPYEMRLDALAPRLTAAVTGSTAANDDNPYTAADLERILRPNDADAAALPQRLAASLGDIAQQSRMRITTESWDTPALIGAAATQVQNFLSGSSVPALVYPWVSANAASPDVAAGLRFNLNRPVRSGPSGFAEQQDYCKGLYTLVLALSGTMATGSNPSAIALRAKAAQWAANVLDFRDEDSTSTRFVYDTNLSDGWNLATSGTVFGVERPDLVIAETAGWFQASSSTGQFFVTLHRPAWRAEQVRLSGTTQRETLAPELGAANQLLLSTSTNTIPATSGTNPTWQLRFDANKVVQFQAVPGGGLPPQTQHVLQSGTVTSRAVTVLGASIAAAAVSPSGHLCVHPSNPAPQRFTVSVTGHDVGSGFSPASAGLKTVWLERLANPALPNSPSNPYIVVDTAPVNVIDVPDPPVLPPQFMKRRRPEPAGSSRGLAAFWNSAGEWPDIPDSEMGKYPTSATNPVPWLHWPNRPFVSHAELVLVPAEGPDDFLQAYAVPTSSLAGDVTIITVGGLSFPFDRLLLDAVHVPSRFAGTAFTLNNPPAVAACGLDELQAGHMSAWREPGRMNVNTISNRLSSAPTSDAALWSTLISGTELRLVDGAATRTVTHNPFQWNMIPPTPATSTAQLVSLSGTLGVPMAAQAFTPTGQLYPRDKNPFLSYSTAIRLANTATIRSHVFAVWITLETVETADNGASSTTYHRLFAIVDRSIPVGFREGENLNVRDTIRLRRFLE